MAHMLVVEVNDAQFAEAMKRLDELIKDMTPALRGIGERLLEAMQRGLWAEPGEHRERIEQHLLELEHHLEEGR